MSSAFNVFSSGPRQPTLAQWIGSVLLSSTRDGVLEGTFKRRYHMDCLTPPLNSGHEGDWICTECAVSPQHTDGSMVEEEISDGELTDLLAEVEDETPTTSSRLRPSTMNRPRTERRHSQRIQSRASDMPDPRPQTSWHVPKYLLRASKPEVTTDEGAARHHSDTSSASVELKTRKRRKRAA
uniref:PHD and RING finger domain-containing protein 1-like isoform X2 n=1 Tax=Epinephelus lanceolatus TaxID=310571 RepID=UPI001445DBC7|nr:PHD and RING finger domain-containing protein 1-like isoform X2 [Epinephelus lanceolatus]